MDLLKKLKKTEFDQQNMNISLKAADCKGSNFSFGFASRRWMMDDDAAAICSFRKAFRPCRVSHNASGYLSRLVVRFDNLRLPPSTQM